MLVYSSFCSWALFTPVIVMLLSSLQKAGRWSKVASRSPSQVPTFTVFFFGGRFGSPTEIDCRKKGTLVLASLLEDLDILCLFAPVFVTPGFGQETGFCF